MPDTNVLRLHDAFVERGPHREVKAVLVVCVGDEFVERFPILLHTEVRRREVLAIPEQAAVFLGRQLFQHRGHGLRHKNDVAQSEEVVDPHADQEQYNRLVGLRGEAPGKIDIAISLSWQNPNS
ncbi:MAG: hypothetical protein WDM89_08590 [Rhizomicrobium sp.]